MGNLHLLFDTAQHNPFFAPVKLQRVTCCKMQRNKRFARTGTGPLQITHSETLFAIGSRTMVER
jgi:hypothetical protein